MEAFDYVVVGAGSAGSVLAQRLAQDPGVTVCVLEAGPSDWHPFLHVPAGFIKTVFDPRFTWQFQTEPGEAIGGRTVALPQGRVVGGSSSVNGMIFNRGQRADYDGWAEAGNRGWGYTDVLPYFKRVERLVGDADERFRGRDGPLPVTRTDLRHPLCDAFISGAVGAGIPANPDFNGETQAGTGTMQRSIYRGWRQSTAKTYLRQALTTGRVALRTQVTVTGLTFDGTRATGVTYLRAGTAEPVKVRAHREVIVAAGAVNSPKLLQLSGIGPASLLGALGIPVRCDLPVGDNLRDHFSVRLVARVKDCLTINEMARGWRLVGQMARWAMGRPSVLALSPALVHWFWKSDPRLNAPDLQGIFTPASYRQGFMGMLDDFPGMTVGVNQHRPDSVGWVRVRSPDPAAPPAVQPNYLAEPSDQQVLVRGIRLARSLLQTPELAPFFVKEELPGPGATTDEDLLGFARSFGTTSYHLVGTCRMGRADDRSAVVDDTLRVHGLQGLRVVDASVMPNIPSANTYAATLMIAEKAADLIRGRCAPAALAGVG